MNPDMTPSTPAQRAVRVLYCNLMDEIKLRTDVILKIQAGIYKIPEQPSFELCYLQLRMICELLALACLAVHGDSTGAKNSKMRSTTKADFILNALEGLHPKFYPEPGVPVTHPEGGESFLPSEATPMTKAELVKLYWSCGEILHRGNIETVRKIRETDFEGIKTTTLKIVDRLKFHKIAFLNSEDELWVTMETPETGKVRATLKRPI